MMKCQKCDSKIKDSDKYCGNCGAKIKKENKFIAFLVRNRIKLLIIVLLIILMITVYNIMAYLTSATYVANKYFKAVVNNDIEEIYETIDLEDNDFMNVKTLTEKINTYNSVTDIYITNKIITNSEALITYTYKENDKLYRAVVSLTKTENKWLLFNAWKVNSGKVASNITLNLPKGSTVTIDGIDLEKYLNEQNDNYDIYKIDYMVDGEYEVKVKLLDGQEIVDTIDIKDNSNYKIGNIDLTDEIEDDVTNDIDVLMTDIYKNILADTSYDNLEYNNNIKKIYKNLNYNYKNSYIKLSNIKFTDFSVAASTFKNGKLTVTFEAEYNYTVNYTLGEVAKTYTGTNIGIIVVSYNYDNEYNIDNIGKINLNFPIRK